MTPPSLKVPNMLLGKSRGQLLIAPQRRKQLGQSGKRCSVTVVSAGESNVDAIKNNTVASTLKQSRCPSADKWIRKLWYIYTMEYYSAMKKNALESVLMRVDETGGYYTE